MSLFERRERKVERDGRSTTRWRRIRERIVVERADYGIGEVERTASWTEERIGRVAGRGRFTAESRREWRSERID